jgi:hypothetical protein
MRAFRRGSNRQWELAGINRAVLRRRMEHSSSAMTERYHSEAVPAAYSKLQNGLLENRENEVAAYDIDLWSGLSESNRHLNLGEVREIKSNALERRHLAILDRALIGK